MAEQQSHPYDHRTNASSNCLVEEPIRYRFDEEQQRHVHRSSTQMYIDPNRTAYARRNSASPYTLRRDSALYGESSAGDLQRVDQIIGVTQLLTQTASTTLLHDIQSMHARAAQMIADAHTDPTVQRLEMTIGLQKQLHQDALLENERLQKAVEVVSTQLTNTEVSARTDAEQYEARIKELEDKIERDTELHRQLTAKHEQILKQNRELRRSKRELQAHYEELTR